MSNQKNKERVWKRRILAKGILKLYVRNHIYFVPPIKRQKKKKSNGVYSYKMYQFRGSYLQEYCEEYNADSYFNSKIHMIPLHRSTARHFEKLFLEWLTPPVASINFAGSLPPPLCIKSVSKNTEIFVIFPTYFAKKAKQN